MVATQLHSFVKSHGTIHLKLVILHTLYLTKPYLFKKLTQTQEPIFKSGPTFRAEVRARADIQ